MLREDWCARELIHTGSYFKSPLYNQTVARNRGLVTPKIPLSKFPFSASTCPGRRPRFHFFFTERGFIRLKLRQFGTILANLGLPSLQERFAILAYGSNACPGQLLRKWQEYRLTNVPVLFGRLGGAEAVYARRRTEGDYIPATLAATNGHGPSWITLLSANQLAAMDASEGRSDYYVLAEVPDLQ